MDLARLAAFLVVHKGTKIWMGVQGEEAEERLFEKLLFGCYSVFVVNPSQREFGKEGRKCKACLGDEQVVLLPNPIHNVRHAGTLIPVLCVGLLRCLTT